MNSSFTDTDRYGDGDVPEIDVEPYQNGSRIVIPNEPLHELKQEHHENSAGRG